MIKCDEFFKELIASDINFFCGVPDSLLKDICAFITDNSINHIITANEGNAIALAAGYHLATNKIGLVYLQNSGLGNCINPLTSLVDKEVYSIPILLLIGWRGEPNKKDEPQHKKIGRITLKILETLEIPYRVLDNNFKEIIKEATNYFEKENHPFAIIVKEKTFEEYRLKNKKQTNFEFSREEALKLIVPLFEKEAIIVSTTGKTSRELFELRDLNKEGHEKDFLTVGSMGHSSSIALGIAISKPNKNVYCIDGDGAIIMHMGVLSTIGSTGPKNFKHLIINNFAHDSVGGQPTAAWNIDFLKIGKANNYKKILSAETKEEIIKKFKEFKKSEGPILFEIKVNKGARENLGRPTISTVQNKKDFMNFLKSSSN